ncbi:MAG: hypothetical protein ACQGVC_09325 [Myxococcota bacterium]
MKRSMAWWLVPVLLLGVGAPLVVSYARRDAPPASAADGPLATLAPPANTAAHDVIVLNGQGYNYGSDQKEALRQVHEELRRRSGEAGER